MKINLKAGDEVFVHSVIEPKLTFTITGIIEESDQLMACGEYGCLAVDLLRKGAPSSPTP